MGPSREEQEHTGPKGGLFPSQGSANHALSSGPTRPGSGISGPKLRALPDRCRGSPPSPRPPRGAGPTPSPAPGRGRPCTCGGAAAGRRGSGEPGPGHPGQAGGRGCSRMGAWVPAVLGGLGSIPRDRGGLGLGNRGLDLSHGLPSLGRGVANPANNSLPGGPRVEDRRLSQGLCPWG